MGCKKKENILLLKVCFEAIASNENATIFIKLAHISLKLFELLLKGLEFINSVILLVDKTRFDTLYDSNELIKNVQFIAH